MRLAEGSLERLHCLVSVGGVGSRGGYRGFSCGSTADTDLAINLA